ncbi:MAG TPA: MSMEG_0565 family glycosyltransferase [Sporichthyaceae bacterium]|nr:MSMEG_0565 family glycosyltransferase [Sporichthyaceae bacterium]
MTDRQSGLSIALLTYSTRPRGGVVHTLALAEALAATGQQVTVWSLARGGDTAFFRPVDPRVRVELVPVIDIPDEPLGPRVRRSIDELSAAFTPDRYDVVHAQDCITANAAGPCIRTVHHLDHFTTPELAACHEHAIVAPHTHVCVSAAVAGELAAGWGIRATVIGNGVEAERFARAAAPGPVAVERRTVWRRRLGPYVLSIGGIEPRKGSIELLESMARVRVQRPDVQLVIAGGETLFDYRDYRAEWERTAQRLALSPVVLGPVAHEELPWLVAAANTFAFPSTKEGFGLAAMEALAAGVPVVTSDLPVLREVFGGAVRLAATPEDFAAALLDSLAVRNERIAAGRALAARHTWAAAARAHLALYGQVAARAA